MLAAEFQKVGQPKEAMKTLLEFISNKRNTRTWTTSHEALMMALMTLTVELKDAPAAKDALYHYRIMTMASVPGSLENVVLHLVNMVESRCEAQRELVGDSASLDEVEDLEQDRGPEDLLMAVAAAEDADELRAHREALVPMVRHGWESFRHVLEALRKLPDLERVYHDVAVRGLRFLASFKRASEFRRLCGAMRYHLIDSMTAANEGDGFSPESLKRHLQTRFEQLARCASLSLWNEAFRTAETIHEIIDFSGEVPDPSFMAAYYDRLAAVFWVSENFLFHAYACYRRCLVNAEGDNAEELATRAILASVVIPRFAKGGDAEADALEGDSERDTKARLAALLAFSSTPSRTSLMEDIRSSDLVEAASPAARDLFRVLEESFAPLDLSAKAAAAMDSIMGTGASAAVAAASAAASGAAGEAPLSRALSSSAAAAAGAVSSADVMRGGDFTLGTYRRRISEQAVMRQVTQLSRAYSTISLTALFGMLAPLGLARTDAEHLIISAVRARALDLRFDHRSGVCRFARDEFHGAALRSHLATLGRRLQSAVALAAESAPSLAEDERFAAAAGLTLKDPARRTEVFAGARKALPAVHEASTNRAQAIRKFRDDVASAKAVKELQVRVPRPQLFASRPFVFRKLQRSRELSISRSASFLTLAIATLTGQAVFEGRLGASRARRPIGVFVYIYPLLLIIPSLRVCSLWPLVHFLTHPIVPDFPASRVLLELLAGPARPGPGGAGDPGPSGSPGRGGRCSARQAACQGGGGAPPAPGGGRPAEAARGHRRDRGPRHRARRGCEGGHHPAASREGRG